MGSQGLGDTWYVGHPTWGHPKLSGENQEPPTKLRQLPGRCAERRLTSFGMSNICVNSQMVVTWWWNFQLFSIFSSDPWENDPIWRTYFSDGLKLETTSYIVVVVSIVSKRILLRVTKSIYTISLPIQKSKIARSVSSTLTLHPKPSQPVSLEVAKIEICSDWTALALKKPFDLSWAKVLQFLLSSMKATPRELGG